MVGSRQVHVSSLLTAEEGPPAGSWVDMGTGWDVSGCSDVPQIVRL